MCHITKITKMKHKSIHNDLIFFLEGSLSSEREQEIREHLETCSGCREFVEVLRTSLSIIEKEKNTALNPYFYQALKAKIENRATSEKSKGLIRILQPAIFTVLLIAGISFGVMMGAKVTGIQTSQNTVDEMYYFNEMGDEPIESYFLN